MATRRFFRPSRMRPAQQSARLLMTWPKFRRTRRGKEYVWVGGLQPTPLSPAYRVRITCSDLALPRVFVTNPPLRDRDGEPIPHCYKDKSLCLNLPSGWAIDSSVAESIIPWASLWLYYYEVWQATGKWLGGGVHPGIAESNHEGTEP